MEFANFSYQFQGSHDCMESPSRECLHTQTSVPAVANAHPLVNFTVVHIDHTSCIELNSFIKDIGVTDIENPHHISFLIISFRRWDIMVPSSLFIHPCLKCSNT